MAYRQFIYPWFPTYRKAMLADENDAMDQVEAALKAIRARMADPHVRMDELERQQLAQAVHYLSLLTRCFEAKGGKLSRC